MASFLDVYYRLFHGLGELVIGRCMVSLSNYFVDPTIPCFFQLLIEVFHTSDLIFLYVDKYLIK